ncbi:MAG: PAS domain S-box protein [Deltaproteobacteria bacterium]|nr:PAS domain S-box protein [Deltaproteobacteria bacterium]
MPAPFLADREVVARFLRDHEHELMQRWERYAAECVPKAREVSPEEWRDHMPLLIRRLIELGETVAGGAAPHPSGAPEAVAVQRLGLGVDLAQHLDELMLLRLAVMKLWREIHPHAEPEEADVLEFLVDYLIRDTAVHYVEARDRILRALDRVSQVALESRDRDQFLHQLIGIILEEDRSVDSASLLVREGDELRLRATVGLEAQRDRHFALRVGEGFAGRIAAERKPRLLHQSEISDGIRVKSPELRALGLRVLYGIPILHGEDLIGVLHVGSRQAEDLSPLIIQLLQTIAGRAGMAIAKQQEQEEIERDQAAVRRAGVRVGLVLESIAEGFMGADLDGRGTFANAAALRLLGYELPADLVGKHLHPLIHHTRADGRPHRQRECPVMRSLRTGEIQHLREEVLWRRDGSPLWVELRSYPVLEGGRVGGAVLSFVDISEKRQIDAERRAALEEVEAERQRLRTVLERLPVGVSIAEAGGRIVGTNPGLQQVFGVAPGQIRSLADLSDLRARNSETGRALQTEQWGLARALRSGESSAGEIIDIERRDGTRATILHSAAPIRGRGGRIVGAVSVTQDITERRALEVELRRQRAELDAVLGAIADGLIVFGPDERVLRVNDAAARMLPGGFTPERRALRMRERVQGWTFLDVEGRVIEVEDLPAMRALRGEVVRSVVFQVRMPGGGASAWLSTSAAPIRGANGRIAGAVLSLADVTTLRRLQEQQQTLIRMVSHDLRTPLGTILLQAELLRRAGGEAGRRGETLFLSAHRMEVMLKDLVDTARYDTGQLALEVQPVEMAGFLDELRTRFAGVLDMERVQTKPPLGPARVLADPDRLERILVNLLSNALKYSTPGTPVRLAWRPEGGGVRLMVADQGVGIPAGELKSIFDRYFRSQRTKSTEGLGLGLSITRMLVEAHGGSISAESRVGQGSTFSFWLPAAKEGSPSTLSGPSAPPPL